MICIWWLIISKEFSKLERLRAIISNVNHSVKACLRVKSCEVDVDQANDSHVEGTAETLDWRLESCSQLEVDKWIKKFLFYSKIPPEY